LKNEKEQEILIKKGLAGSSCAAPLFFI